MADAESTKRLEEWLVETALALCVGSVGDLLYGASLMPNLKVLDASDQALAGQLPSVVLPLLEELNLANNSIQVLPPAAT